MDNVSFSQMLNAVSHIEIRNYISDFEVKKISIDTRTLKQGDIFLAIIGPNFDGHDYIDVAIEKGASGLILSKENLNYSVPIMLVEDTIATLKEIAKYYRTTINTKVIAITGSSGKTTTKDMLSSLLKSKYQVSSTEKNENNEIGVALTILNIPSAAEVAVIEMGMNHIGEISQSAQIALPDIGIITNIGTAHIGNLGTKENILKAKLELLDGLKKEGILIINGEDEMLCSNKIEFPNIIKSNTVKGNDDDSYISEVLQERDGIKFSYHMKDIKKTIFIPISGKHNVKNAAIAIKCALLLNVSIDDIVQGFKFFVGNSLRSEIISINGINIIKDYYNSNPESMDMALENLRSFPCKGRKIAIIGEILEMGVFAESIHKEFGDKFREIADYTFFVGKSYEAFLENDNGRSFGCEQKYDLYNKLGDFNRNIGFNNGDVILIKGSRAMQLETVFERLKKIINAKKDERMMRLPSASAKLYVDINAIKKNISEINLYLKRMNEKHVEIMPVIKANAYGCGSETVVNVYRNSKYIAVADANEATIVKSIFPEKEILILYQPDYDEIESIIENDVIVGVCNIKFIKRLNEYAILRDKFVKIHVEVDTGSNRLGIMAQEYEDFIEQVLGLSNIVIEGIYTHYICADSDCSEDVEYTNMQTRKFDEAVCIFEEKCPTLKYKHACSSAAIFTQPNAHYNMVRPGYMIYGYYQSDFMRDYVKLKPVLKLATNIIYIKEIEKDEFVSYGRTFKTTRKSKIATLAIGYADGYNRLLSNKGFVVVNGQKAPIVGRVCMDMTMIDITDIVGNIQIGDEVFLFDNENITIEDIAKLCGTIGYEIITNIEDKVERIEIF